jgi:hypothetical protein
MTIITVGDTTIMSTFVTVGGIHRGSADLINTDTKAENESSFNKNPS